jgi:hypothetical protein
MANQSLPSIDPKTVAQIKLALTAYGPDAEFLATFVESVMKVTKGSGFGKISVYVQDKQVTMIRSEETHAFSRVEEKKI